MRRRENTPGSSIVDLFEEQAVRNPEATALVFDEQQMSYGVLNRKANQVAHFLMEKGVGPEVAVGLCLDRSIEMVIGMLAILKAGGAYVPMDGTYPTERLRYIAQDARLGVIVSQGRFKDALEGCAAAVLLIDEQCDEISNRDEQNLEVGAAADNLAYVIYTSGSTGNPKGAMNTHRALANRLLWMQDAYQLSQSDSVLQKTPFTFDVSVWEFFWPLLVGARLVVARPGGHKDPSYLASVIVEQKITVIHFVPSMLQVFLSDPRVDKCNCLRAVICSGEALQYSLERRFFEKIDAKLHNLYGPTEAAIDVTYWECARENATKTVPIGRPIWNIQVYVLDGDQRPVPVGMPGELHIGGVGLARGYLGRADVTAERFVPNSMSSEMGERLYRTGDICRQRRGGEIEYLGRADNQVKMRGYRIELGEIEAALETEVKVTQAVVLAREDSAGGKKLVGYVVTEDGQEITSQELRTYLKEKLPEYMVPSAIITVKQIPLTMNGKINKNALARIDEVEDRVGRRLSREMTRTEKILCGIWSEVLNLEQVGTDENFFDLGGHSLLATLVISRIWDNFVIEVSLMQLFDEPTIGGLAEIIDRELNYQAEASEVSTDVVFDEVDFNF